MTFGDQSLFDRRDLLSFFGSAGPAEPLLTTPGSQQFVVADRKELEKRGGIAIFDAGDKDTATDWLNQNSAGTGRYALVGWTRNSNIQLAADPSYWGGKPFFQRIGIRKTISRLPPTAGGWRVDKREARAS